MNEPEWVEGVSEDRRVNPPTQKLLLETKIPRSAATLLVVAGIAFAVGSIATAVFVNKLSSGAKQVHQFAREVHRFETRMGAKVAGAAYGSCLRQNQTRLALRDIIGRANDQIPDLVRTHSINASQARVATTNYMHAISTLQDADCDAVSRQIPQRAPKVK